MKILALLDGRPGNDNQTIAIAEQLGEYETLKVEFGFLSRLPNFLLGKSLIGIKSSVKKHPDLVISTGRKLARVSARMKQRTKCKAIQIMKPQMSLSNYDLVFVPEHDNIRKHKNLHKTVGAPNRIDSILLAAQDWEFDDNINVALIGDIEPKQAKQLKNIENLHISTSRRTSPEAVEALRALKPKYIYVWGNEGENPYYGLLASAQNIIVSADSVGMISESCTTGKKVYILGKPQKRKFKRFISKLLGAGYAMRLKDFGKDWTPKKLSTRDEVVKIIKNVIET